MQIDWIDLAIAPIVGALIGFGVWYFQPRIEALRRAREELHDDRRKAYAEILEPFIRILAGIKNPRESDKAIKQVGSYDFKRTAFEFTLIGSDEVVRAFNDLMQHVYRSANTSDAPTDPKEFLVLWAALLLSIRRDVGDSRTALSPVDMLRSQITDIDAAWHR